MRKRSRRMLNEAAGERLSKQLGAALSLEAPGVIAKAAIEAERFCKSPIEEIFFCAWWARSRITTLRVADRGFGYMLVCNANAQVADVVATGPKHWAFSAAFDEDTDGNRYGILDLVLAQHKVHPYVADFVLVRVSSHVDGWQAAAIAVECDGKDFHDATTEQVSRDRARDRHFQMAGIPAMRFSGSELFRDPIRCAHEASGALMSALGLSKTVPHNKTKETVGA